MLAIRPNALFRVIPLLSLLSTGCYPGGVSTEAETDTVVTVKNPDAVFAHRRTYAMTDSVVDLCAEVPTETPETSADAGVPAADAGAPPTGCDSSTDLDHRYDSQILNVIRTNMNNMGYTEVEDPTNTAADVVVLVGAARTKLYVYGTYCQGWGYWWAGWPGWGPYPPGGGGGWTVVCSHEDVITDVYDVGTLLLHMVDPKNADTGQSTIPTLWLAVTNGVLDTGKPGTGGRLQRTIDQAFAQSPYLEVEP